MRLSGMFGHRQHVPGAVRSGLSSLIERHLECSVPLWRNESDVGNLHVCSRCKWPQFISRREARIKTPLQPWTAWPGWASRVFSSYSAAEWLLLRRREQINTLTQLRQFVMQLYFAVALLSTSAGSDVKTRFEAANCSLMLVLCIRKWTHTAYVAIRDPAWRFYA